MLLSLDLRDIDTAAQYEFWQGVTPAAYRIGRVANGNGLNARASFWWLDGVMASRFAAGAHQIIRGENAIRRSRVPFIKIRLYRTGSAWVHDGARAHDLRAGDVHVIDQSRPWSARYQAHDQYSILVPHERAGYDPSQEPVVRTFRAESPEGRLLTLSIRAFYAALETGEDDTTGLLSLVETALHDDMRRARNPSFKAKRDAAIRLLARNAGGGLQLQASSLAQDFGVSRATVYRIFREDGGLQRFRKTALLDRAFNRLAGRDLQRGEISRIASALGFYSTAHFSDAFLDRFGVRPSEAGRLSARPEARRLAPINDPRDLEATMRLTRDLYARVT